MTSTPPAIRILPMSQEEFPNHSIEDLQHQFFLRDFPFEQDGEYWYQSSGLNSTPGTVVLFQFRNSLVASAVLSDVETFEETEVENGFEYHGALHFEVGSIRVFDPIGLDIVKNIWPNVTSFGHVKWKLDPEQYAKFERELNHVEAPSA